MMGNPVNKDAANIYHVVEPGTVGAEIGVWMANSSVQFLNRGVKHLHLVDSWSVQPYKEQIISEHGSFQNYLDKYSKMVGGNTEQLFTKYYEDVYKYVDATIGQQDNVTIHRMTSDEWFESYDGELLDWIYVDGDHSEEGCYKDLCNALKVVKPGGQILGDDYKWNPLGPGKKGVTAAVNKFLDEHHFHVRQHGMLQFEITTK